MIEPASPRFQIFYDSFPPKFVFFFFFLEKKKGIKE